MFFKLCFACSTMVSRQVDLKQYLTLAIYSTINYIIEFSTNNITYASNNTIKNFTLVIFKVFAIMFASQLIYLVKIVS